MATKTLTGLRLFSILTRQSPVRFFSASARSLDRDATEGDAVAFEEETQHDGTYKKEERHVDLNQFVRWYKDTRLKEVKSGMRAGHYEKLLEADIVPTHYMPTNSIPRYLLDDNHRLSSDMVKLLREQGRELTRQAVLDLQHIQSKAAEKSGRERKRCEQLYQTREQNWEEEATRQEEDIQQHVQRLEKSLAKIRQHMVIKQDVPIEVQVCRRRKFREGRIEGFQDRSETTE